MEMVWCYATSSMYQNDTVSMYTKSTSILFNNFCLFNTHKNDQIKSTALYELSSIYSMVKVTMSVMILCTRRSRIVVYTNIPKCIQALFSYNARMVHTCLLQYVYIKSFSQPALLIDKYRKDFNKDRWNDFICDFIPVQEPGTEIYYDAMDLTRPKRRFKPKVTKTRLK
ncbi:uncharacterized protein EV154DRAFT_484775 [Mucor mucedo]|uniref:uncharacterized protein n=1 Tax=Mucor mucedo TaxID=29922 RepID=UPI00221F7360|nr:uncharacterized protein EV154DRAFT_484775 [Mucor mucedo]KAI7887687.1 hypothetical protein EV154DRAFT_484775 [Mucor mucedo]